jgi:NAD(P)-dependent dehydrogenase (short-subunit alcohol dehydrogenase family)
MATNVSTNGSVSRGAIVITGASTGIGESCALRLDRAGFTVYAGVRKDADAERLRQQGSARLTPIRLDVTDESTIDAARQQVTAAVGRSGIAGLVNNAGIGLGGPIEFLPLDEWRTQFEVNVFGTIAVTQAFMPLIRLGAGRIVVIGSIAGRFASPFISPYCASKHALEAFADALRFELKPWKIDVAIVEPGSIATPIWDKAESTFERLKRELPAQAMELYGDAIAAIDAFTKDAAKRGIPPDMVARVVQHALTAKRPKTRYLVGTDARLQAAASTVLPDRMLDRLIASQLKIGKTPSAAKKQPEQVAP